MHRTAIATTLWAMTLLISGAAEAANQFTLTSPDVKPGATMSDEQAHGACKGKNISPALSWIGAPKGTKSFALSVYDPDAPTGSGFWHWVVFNIQPSVTSLAKGAGDPKANLAPTGAIQSRTDWGAPGYGGPCPPKGDRPHHYYFKLFALDIDKIDADENTSAAVIGFNIHFHTLGQATLLGRWGD